MTFILTFALDTLILLLTDYKIDGRTQEAGLFRRTNLYQCLDMEPRRTEFYPLPNQGAAYCPNMIVLRKSSKDNDAFMDRPDWMSFLVCLTLSLGISLSILDTAFLKRTNCRHPISNAASLSIQTNIGHGTSQEASTSSRWIERDDSC